MLTPDGSTQIYLCASHTDMRKGASSLALLASSLCDEGVCSGAMYIFRGKSANKIKILWYDGQGFCLFYKCFDCGQFIWPKAYYNGVIGITRAQLSMLIEGVDWRNPRWSKPPEYVG